MENVSKEKGADGINEDNDAFGSIRKLFQNVNENNLIQIQNEYAIQYLKTETEKLKEATIDIKKKRIKLEDQNVVLEAQEKALRGNIESSALSLQLKTQLVATLQQQTDNSQTELKALQVKCANTLSNFQTEYEAVKEQYKKNHPLYKEFSNAQISSLKAEIEMKILQKKLSDLKRQHKLRLKINHQLFNRSIVQFVQALVDYRKGNPEIEGIKKDENLQKSLPIKTSNNFLDLDLEKFSLELKSFSNIDLPLSTFEVSRPTDYYNNDQLARQIQTRNEQRDKKLQQSYSSFFLNKRSSDLLKNNTSKPSENISAMKSDIQSVINDKKNQNAFPSDNEEPTVPEKYLILPSEQVDKQLSMPDSITQTSTEKRRINDDLPNNKKINIIDIQYIPTANQKKTDVILMNLPNSKNLLEDRLSSAINQFSVFNQRPETLPLSVNQTRLDSIQKPDLVVSPFFDIPNPVQLETQLRNNSQDLATQNILSYMTTQSDDSNYVDEPMMNLWSPINESVNTENNTDCMQPDFNFGQSNANKLSGSQPNTIFAQASSHIFNMFS